MITQMKFLQLLPLLLVVLPVTLRPVLGHSLEVDSANSRIRCLERERQALLKIKDELVDPHGVLSSWGNQENKRDCCKWRGVHCHNRTNHVTGLNLRGKFGYSSSHLKGMVSTPLLELQHLQYLDLSYNDFDYAPIPEFIGSLTELRYLNLRGANFSGQIPHHLGNLSKLLHLDLGSTADMAHPLTYNLNCDSKSLDWVSHLHSLEYLDLSATNLSKATDWLQAISKLTSIKELYLEGCALPDIPPSSLPSINVSTPLAILHLASNWNILSPLTLVRWFSNFSSTGLTSIDLSFNSMPGPIPDVFQNMISLAHLHLIETGLEGGIPKYFGNMSSLTDIDLSSNNLTGELFELMMNLSGPIGEKLQYLWLTGNGISGSLCNMSSFSSLKPLHLRANQLNGSIQEGYLQLPYIHDLDLSINQFTGPVPDLSFSSSLKKLSLENNMFNEISPQSIGRLSQLEVLSIGSNLLEGIITEVHVFNLSRLRILDVSLNSLLKVKFSPHWVPPFQLEYLNLRRCKLGPYFPLWLRTQTEFVCIDISDAGISDSIPSWLGGIAPELLYLNASNNQMYGVFPDFSFSTISSRDFSRFPHFSLSSSGDSGGVILDLSRNNISGSLSFLCHTRDCELLDISDNQLFDQIPDCFAGFQRLKYLNLANNHFHGKIPYSFGSLSALSLLHLRNNNLSGELPTSLVNCTELKMIDLGENRLTGRIPGWIGDRFSQLKVLVLRFNEFSGSIPSNLCRLENIQILDLSSNKISGVAPNCVHKYIAMTREEDDNPMPIAEYPIAIWLDYPLELQLIPLETSSLESAFFMWKGKEVKYTNHLGLVRLIDLSSNNLGGEIPSDITKLVGLVGLNLSANNLTGSIPQNIGQLKSLNFLDFSRNHLSGCIPTSLGQLSHLGVLNLSYNNLSGRIPPSTQLLTFNESAYMGNSGLCGLPLNKSCQGDESHQDSDSRVDGNSATSRGDSEDDKFITEEFYIAMGLGFIVGFWGIFGTILLNRAMRYAFFNMLNAVEDFVYVRMELSKARLLRRFQNR